MSTRATLLIIFVTGALLGQLAVFAIAYTNRQDEAIRDNQRPQYGVIASIDQVNSYFILDVPEEYQDATIQKRKIYFDKNTIVMRRDLLQENGIIYGETEAIPSTLADIQPGYKAVISFIVEEKRFYATHIIYGFPFPDMQ